MWKIATIVIVLQAQAIFGRVTGPLSGISGGILERPVDDDTVLELLDEGLKQLDSISPFEHKLKAEEVLSASTQVVAGTVWRIQASVVESDCTKTGTTPSEECGTIEGAQPTVCDFSIWQQPWQETAMLEVECEGHLKVYTFQSNRRQ